MNVINQQQGEHHTIYNGDSCEVIKGIPDNSVDFSIYSPPFSNLYIYSDSEADMGNAANDEEFFQHYEYLIKEKYRIHRPGRLTAVHCKDLPAYMNRDGYAGLRDFPGEIIRAHENHGWQYHSRVTIWKDPVIEMQRTKNHGLLHKNFVARAEACRQGMPDYLLVFRKYPIEGGIEVKHEFQIGEYEGYNEPTYDEIAPRGKRTMTDNYSIAKWQRYASPIWFDQTDEMLPSQKAIGDMLNSMTPDELVSLVRATLGLPQDKPNTLGTNTDYAWFDIDMTDVLNYQIAKSGKDEKHIAPLQLGVIRRAIDLWTQEGDIVFTPFLGIGSEAYEAIRMRRFGVGIELKPEYFDIARRNCDNAESERGAKTLWDWAAENA